MSVCQGGGSVLEVSQNTSVSRLNDVAATRTSVGSAGFSSTTSGSAALPTLPGTAQAMNGVKHRAGHFQVDF